MKLRMALLLTGMIASSVSAAAWADVPVPGGSVNHTLTCGSPEADGHPVVGVGYQLTCSTAAVDPQYSVRGCELSSRVVYPGAKPTLIPLTEVKQSVGLAIFSTPDNEIKVVLDKQDMSATLLFTGGETASCNPES